LRADIEGARAALAARRARGPHLPAVGRRRFTLTDDGLRIIIALLVTLAAPVFGLFLACFFAFQAHTDGRTRTRNVMLLLAVLAAIPPATGISIWGRFIGGY
jgi:hypothetical protein